MKNIKKNLLIIIICMLTSIATFSGIVNAELIGSLEELKNSNNENNSVMLSPIDLTNRRDLYCIQRHGLIYEDYKTKYDTYQQYLPFYLYDEDNVLAVEDIDANWIHFDTHSISNDNKEMLHVIALGHNSYETTNIYNIQYNLGGKYDTVTGTIFIADTYKSTIQTSYFEAYGDGKLLYTSPKMEKGMLPQDIWFHVTDIQNLEIKFYTRTDSTLWSSEIGVSNLTAQKDFPA